MAWLRRHVGCCDEVMGFVHMHIVSWCDRAISIPDLHVRMCSFGTLSDDTISFSHVFIVFCAVRRFADTSAGIWLSGPTQNFKCVKHSLC